MTVDVPYGYCHCGCGQKTGIIDRTQRCKNRIKGEPAKFIPGHHNVLRAKAIEERFWSKVGEHSNPDECWNWIASINGGGYGKIFYNGKHVDSHRMAWILTYGEIPEGLQVCHTCDNRKCVNPNHLFLGTPLDNMVDKQNKGRAKAPQGEKQNKHKLTDQQVQYIREMHNLNKLDARAAASQMGVGLNTIRRVIKRETWRHI